MSALKSCSGTPKDSRLLLFLKEKQLFHLLEDVSTSFYGIYVFFLLTQDVFVLFPSFFFPVSHSLFFYHSYALVTFPFKMKVSETCRIIGLQLLGLP